MLLLSMSTIRGKKKEKKTRGKKGLRNKMKPDKDNRGRSEPGCIPLQET